MKICRNGGADGGHGDHGIIMVYVVNAGPIIHSTTLCVKKIFTTSLKNSLQTNLHSAIQILKFPASPKNIKATKKHVCTALASIPTSSKSKR